MLGSGGNEGSGEEAVQNRESLVVVEVETHRRKTSWPEVESEVNGLSSRR